MHERKEAEGAVYLPLDHHRVAVLADECLDKRGEHSDAAVGGKRQASDERKKDLH